jgi:hypothetical protein
MEKIFSQGLLSKEELDAERARYEKVRARLLPDGPLGQEATRKGR